MAKNKCTIDIDMQIGWMKHNLEKTRKAIVTYKEKIPHMVEQFEEVEAYEEAILESLQKVNYLNDIRTHNENTHP